MNGKWQIVLAILLMLAFGFLDWQLGERYQVWFTAAMPLVLLVALFLLVIWALGRHRREVRQILETHLPGAYFIINDPKRLDAEMVATIRRADKFIMTTGGRARGEEYLSAIEKKILENPQIEYWRVVLGDYIHHRLHQHLEGLFECPNVHIRWQESEIYGHVLVSEDQVVLFFPDPVPGTFGSGQVILDPNTAAKYKEAVIRLHGEARSVNREEFRIRCYECSSGIETAPTETAEGA